MGRLGVNAWRQLSPPGTSAVLILAVTGDLGRLTIRTPGGSAASWPAPDECRLRLLCDGASVLDEALVVGTQRGAELHLHGGAGTVEAVKDWLGRAGFAGIAASDEPVPSSLRHARALLSASLGPLAELSRFSCARLGDEGSEEAPARRESLLETLRRCLDQRALGHRMARTPVVALVGAPNAGKSTLFNALVGSERALVAPEAGTTRDPVTALVRWRGLAVRLCDTAGQLPPGPPETSADILVHVLDVPDDCTWPARPGQPLLRVLGKRDRWITPGVLSASGTTGEGVPELRDRIADALSLPVETACDLWAPASPALLRWIDDLSSGPNGGCGDSQPLAT